MRPCLAWSTQDERQTWEEEKVVTWACLVSGKVRIFGELSAVSRVVTEAKEDNETPKGRQRRVAQGPQDGVGPCPALQPRCHPLSRQVAPLTTPFLQGGGRGGAIPGSASPGPGPASASGSLHPWQRVRVVYTLEKEDRNGGSEETGKRPEKWKNRPNARTPRGRREKAAGPRERRSHARERPSFWGSPGRKPDGSEPGIK